MIQLALLTLCTVNGDNCPINAWIVLFIEETVINSLLGSKGTKYLLNGKI